MFALTIALAVLAGGSFVLIGLSKLVRRPMMVEAREHLGVPPPIWAAVGALELLGGAGLAIGLHADLPVIGVLAAAGLVALTIGAAFYHQRAGDEMRDWMPAVVMGSLAIFYAILRIATA